MIILPKNHQVFQSKQPLRILIGNAHPAIITGFRAIASFDFGGPYLISSVAGGAGAAAPTTWDTTFIATYEAWGAAIGSGSKITVFGDDYQTTNFFFFHSTDDGATWSVTDTGISSVGALTNAVICSELTNHDSQWACVVDSGGAVHLWHSTDGGATWSHATPLTVATNVLQLFMDTACDGTNVYVAIVRNNTVNSIAARLSMAGAAFFSISGGSWGSGSPDYLVSCVGNPTDPTKQWMFSANGFFVELIWPGGALYSQFLNNVGVDTTLDLLWRTKVGTLLTPVFNVGSTLIRVYRSTDSGRTWTAEPTGANYSFGTSNAQSQAADGTIIVPLNSDARLLFSKDDGQTWDVTAAILASGNQFSADAG